MGLLGLFFVTLCCQPATVLVPGGRDAAPSVVRIRHEANGYRLTCCNGEPFLIKGAGGDASMPYLVQCGGNSVRTWGAEAIGETLEQAQKLGVKVMAGIWLQHQDAMNYSDKKAVAAQLEMCREVVRKYKNHPALLMWTFGNEMEGDGRNDDVWRAVEDIAKMAHQEDPNHPTCTVICEDVKFKIGKVEKFCPDIDVVGLNSYGGSASLPQRYAEGGGKKPYIVTEWGPVGHWEVERTRWGAPIEPTSTEKIPWYENGYKANVIGNASMCLGGYAFTWGHKIEVTPTWFGMFMPDDRRTPAVDVMTKFWTGKDVEHPCPSIDHIKLAKVDHLRPGETIAASVVAKDSKGNPCTLKWTLLREIVDWSDDVPREVEAGTVPGASIDVAGENAKLKLPVKPGPYRLYVEAYDQWGGAACANVPIYIDATTAANGDVPLSVYSDSGKPMAFIPSGWMGDTGAMKLDMNCQSNPHSGSTCIQFDYSATNDWGGIVWQFPEGDWGNDPRARNVSGAKRLSFWMRGAQGGEKVTAKVGLIGADKPYHDSAQASSGDITLTPSWKRYEIDLQGMDLSSIKTGFAIIVAGQGHPIRIFLDDIRYE